MLKTLEQLKVIGDESDKLGMDYESSQITSSMQTLLDVKTAQYLGINGYWIRNRRCWDNCYRTKRIETPEKPAQEVWSECHQEYIKTINSDDTSEWDKYAGDDKDIKTASKNVVMTKEASRFNKMVDEKMQSGLPIPNAVYDTIEKEASKQEDKIYKVAEQLTSIAERFQNKGNDELAKKTAEIAVELIKYAQAYQPGFWQKAWDWVGSRGKKEPYNIKKLLSIIDQILEQATKIKELWGGKFVAQPPQQEPPENQNVPEVSHHIAAKEEKEIITAQSAQTRQVAYMLNELGQRLNATQREVGKIYNKLPQNSMASDLAQRVFYAINAYNQSMRKLQSEAQSGVKHTSQEYMQPVETLIQQMNQVYVPAQQAVQQEETQVQQEQGQQPQQTQQPAQTNIENMSISDLEQQVAAGNLRNVDPATVEALVSRLWKLVNKVRPLSKPKKSQSNKKVVIAHTKQKK